MSVRRIALTAGLLAVTLSTSASPLMAATPVAVPDVGVRVAPAAVPGTALVSPWVWEPDASDSLRISVGSRTRRLVVRTWLVAGAWRGRLVEQQRTVAGGRWHAVRRTQLSADDLAGGSTDPGRTTYARAGFLAFDAATLGVEDHGGLAYSVVAADGRRLIVRFGARHERTHTWTTVTRIIPADAT